jgi:DNA-binding NarL/FixJ family response regulator
LKSPVSLLDFKAEDYSVETHDASPARELKRELQTTRIAIIDGNALSRCCLTRCLLASEPNFAVESHSGIEHLRPANAKEDFLIVLLCATGRQSTEAAVRRDLDLLSQSAPEARVIVVSDFEESSEIIAALERGARGYIGMSANVDVAIAAIKLVRAGGTFVPASGLLPSRTQASPAEPDGKQPQSGFTQRQIEVIDRLRQGESNKIIAYKLNMGECTVKVHVRNIMRKLKARNRTEIAFLTKELF